MLAGGKQGAYQGTSFRMPFFFLLVESFESSVAVCAGVVAWVVVELDELWSVCPAAAGWLFEPACAGGVDEPDDEESGVDGLAAAVELEGLSPPLPAASGAVADGCTGPEPGFTCGAVPAAGGFVAAAPGSVAPDVLAVGG